MAILLALGASLSWGIGDFFGGRSSRAESVLAVMSTSQAVQVVLLPFVAVLVGGTVTGNDLVLGAAGGIFGTAALAVFYRAMADGPMVVVAPVTGVTSVVIPVIWGLAGGERLGALALVGIVVGVAAIGLITSADGDGDAAGWRVVGLALAAGVGFSSFFIFFDATGDDAGLWPLVAARAVSAPLVFVAAAAVGTGFAPRLRANRAQAAGAGIFDSTANGLFITATASGDLALVSVLASLYPAVTVGLANAVEGETIRRIQAVGMALGAVAVVLLTVG